MIAFKVPGLDVDIRDGAVMTALMWAAFHSRIEQVRVLIGKGANPSARDMDGMSAVHWSVQRHDTRVLQVYKSDSLNLLLYCCVVIKMLINAASAQYADGKGKTVMHQAAEQVSSPLWTSWKCS